MSKEDLHRLVDELPDEAVDGASLMIQRVLSSEIDPDQAWVWTAEWQERLRQSLNDIAAGRTYHYPNGQAFLESLA